MNQIKTQQVTQDAELIAAESTPVVGVPPAPTAVSTAPESASGVGVETDVPKVDIKTPPPAAEVITATTDEVMVKAKREWRVGIMVLAVFLAMSGFAGYGYYRFVHKREASVSTAVVTTATPMPAATSSPDIVERKPRLAVWNGSGVSGAAGKLSEQLKTAGYEVIEAKTAPSEQVGTTLLIANSVKSEKAALLKALEAAGIVIGTTEELVGDSDYEVRIVLGK